MPEELSFIPRDAKQGEIVLSDPEQHEHSLSTGNYDIGKLSVENNVAFVHGIASVIPEYNSLLFRNTSWQTRMDLAFALSPTLSCSSIRPGDSISNLWFPVGLVLNKGRVEAASQIDAGTRATGIKSRYSKEVFSSDLDKNIHQALGSHDRYNEITVSNPEPVGIYICKDETTDTKGMNMGGMNDITIYQYAQERGLPVFIMKQGVLYKSKFIEESHQPVPGTDRSRFTPARFEQAEEMALTEIVGLPPMADSLKHELEEKLLHSECFRQGKLRIQELDDFCAYSEGRSFYVKLNWKNILGRVSAQDEEIQLSPDDTIMGKSIEKLAHYQGREEYYLVNGKLLSQRTYPDQAEISNIWITSTEQKLNGLINRGVPISAESLTNYFDEISQALTYIREQIESNPDSRVNYRGRLENIAYHLRGMADEARKYGDKPTADRCLSISAAIVSSDIQSEVLARRTGPKGEFVFTKEDLK